LIEEAVLVVSFKITSYYVIAPQELCCAQTQHARHTAQQQLIRAALCGASSVCSTALLLSTNHQQEDAGTWLTGCVKLQVREHVGGRAKAVRRSDRPPLC
jgi:hypothetical protein